MITNFDRIKRYVPGRSTLRTRDMNKLASEAARVSRVSYGSGSDSYDGAYGRLSRSPAQLAAEVAVALKHPFKSRIDPTDDTKIEVGFNRSVSGPTPDGRDDFARIEPWGETIDATLGTKEFQTPETIVVATSAFVFYEIQLRFGTAFTGGVKVDATLKTFGIYPPLHVNPITGALDASYRFNKVVGYATVSGGVITRWDQMLFENIEIPGPPTLFKYVEDGVGAGTFEIRVHEKDRDQVNPLGPASGSVVIPASSATSVFYRATVDAAVSARQALVLTDPGQPRFQVAVIFTDGSGKLTEVRDFLSLTPTLGLHNVGQPPRIYFPTGDATDRAFNPTTTTVLETGNVLATLIRDLARANILDVQ